MYVLGGVAQLPSHGPTPETPWSRCRLPVFPERGMPLLVFWGKGMAGIYQPFLLPQICMEVPLPIYAKFSQIYLKNYPIYTPYIRINPMSDICDYISKRQAKTKKVKRIKTKGSWRGGTRSSRS